MASHATPSGRRWCLAGGRPAALLRPADGWTAIWTVLRINAGSAQPDQPGRIRTMTRPNVCATAPPIIRGCAADRWLRVRRHRSPPLHESSRPGDLERDQVPRAGGIGATRSLERRACGRQPPRGLCSGRIRGARAGVGRWGLPSLCLAEPFVITRSTLRCRSGLFGPITRAARSGLTPSTHGCDTVHRWSIARWSDLASPQVKRLLACPREDSNLRHTV